MTDEGIKHLIAKLMTDDSFRSKFTANPADTMTESGYALDQEEMAALSEINLEDLAITVVRQPGPLKICHGQPTTKE